MACTCGVCAKYTCNVVHVHLHVHVHSACTCACSRDACARRTRLREVCGEAHRGECHAAGARVGQLQRDGGGGLVERGADEARPREHTAVAVRVRAAAPAEPRRLGLGLGLG